MEQAFEWVITMEEIVVALITGGLSLLGVVDYYPQRNDRRIQPIVLLEKTTVSQKRHSVRIRFLSICAK